MRNRHGRQAGSRWENAQSERAFVFPDRWLNVAAKSNTDPDTRRKKCRHASFQRQRLADTEPGRVRKRDEINRAAVSRRRHVGYTVWTMGAEGVEDLSGVSVAQS